jgi:hypothetical protein
MVSVVERSVPVRIRHSSSRKRPMASGPKRRTRGSNPQPLTGHIISNDAANHSLILQMVARLQKA